MSNTVASSVIKMKISPEIENALASIDIPEVQEMIRRLAPFNLGVCVPHMHLPNIDFAPLPKDLVQVEEDCRVSWISRSKLEAMPESIPVAWRWVDDGVQAAAKCMSVCSPNPKKGHIKTGHLPG